MFVSFLLAGRYLETCTRRRAESALEDSVGRLPETALRENGDGTVASVSTLRLKRDDMVRVPLGQAFCVGGRFTLGTTHADESPLSGESAPVAKAPCDGVVAGSLKLGSPVEMRVERVDADTRYEAIVAMMREARSHRPGALRDSNRWAAPFLWAVMLLAAGAAAAWSVIDPSLAVWVAVTVLIVTCPCALSLAAHSALLSAATAMARRGVLLRRIDAIEGLARMQTLFIDKAGTLTEAQSQSAQMTRVEGASTLRDAALRERAASLAVWSLHPLAKAIATVGGRFLWTDLREMPGQGLQGRANDLALWRLGRSAASLDATDTFNAPGDAAEVDVWLSRQRLPMLPRASLLRSGH